MSKRPKFSGLKEHGLHRDYAKKTGKRISSRKSELITGVVEDWLNDHHDWIASERMYLMKYQDGRLEPRNEHATAVFSQAYRECWQETKEEIKQSSVFGFVVLFLFQSAFKAFLWWVLSHYFGEGNARTYGLSVGYDDLCPSYEREDLDW